MASTGWIGVAIWIASGVAALVGIAAVYLALLHDRSRGRRRCPVCWYDMSGNVESRTCSECGHEAINERMLTRTRRRPWRAVFGCGLIAASIFSVSYVQVDVQSIKPVWLLSLEMHAHGQRGEDARRELIKRGRDDRLSIHQQQQLADEVLAIQSDLQAVWTSRSYPVARDAEWAPMFEEAWRRGALRDEQVQQYFRHAFELVFDFEHRPRVRAGEPIPIAFSSGQPRLYTWDYLDVMADHIIQHVRLATFDGLGPSKPPLPAMFGGHMQARPPPRVADIPRDFILGSSRSASTQIRSLLPPIHTPGQHEVTLHLMFSVAVSSGTSMHAGAAFDLESAIAQWERDITFTVEVLPRDQSPVALVPDPSMRDVIRSLLQISLNSQLEVGRNRYGGPDGVVLVHPTLPVNLGFDLFARSGARERWLGTVIAHAELDRVQNVSRWTRNAKALFDEPFVDVILRANPHVAERTVDILDIWDGEITIENVPLHAAPAN